MKKTTVSITLLWGILSSIILLPTPSFAVGLFNTETEFLVIPEVDINGDTFYDNVTLKLDFATGRFELVSFDEKSETISVTPLDTMEDQDIKMDFMGCTRSGRNEVTCYVKLTSQGGLDRRVKTFVANVNINSLPTRLFDNSGNAYQASEVIVGNLKTNSSITVDLIAGIPILAKYKFTDISPNASSLSLFRPAFFTDTSFLGDFRNINF